jgi:hypothetical protein
MPIFLDESKPGNVAEAGDQEREIAEQRRAMKEAVAVMGDEEALDRSEA